MARTAKAKGPGGSRLTRDADTGTAFRRFVQNSNDALLRLEADAARMNSETIHHCRTTTRRLRSILTNFKAILPDQPRRELSEALKTLAKRYGALRELDVFLEALQKPLAKGGPDRDSFVVLDRATRAARQEEQARNQTLAADIAAIDRVLAASDWLHEPAPAQAKVWHRTLSGQAPKLLDQQRRQLRREAKRLDLADPAALHKFRIHAKRHRYMIEFVSFLYKKKKVKPYLDRLVEIQDMLGEMRDTETARELVVRLPVPDSARDVAKRWLARRFAASRKRYPAAGRAFRGMKPFWE